MVNDRQRKEIKRRMRRVKDAKDSGKPAHIIEERTAELYRYLEREGIVNPFDE